MKTNPYQRFADGNPPPNAMIGGFLPLPIDSFAGYDKASGQTLGAALFGDSMGFGATGFDFSRLIQAIIPTRATLLNSPLVDAHDGGPRVLARTLDTPFEAEEPTQYLSYERTPDAAVEPTLVQSFAPVPVVPVPFGPAPVVSVGALSDLNEGAPNIPADTLATPLATDDVLPSLLRDRIPDLGFLQNLPAIVLLQRPSPDQSETAIRPADSTVLPLGSEPVAVAVAVEGGGSVTRSDLIHDLRSAIVAETIVPLTLLFDHDAAADVVVRDVFITDPAPVPDFASVQFAAVMPDPIVDPGPLV